MLECPDTLALRAVEAGPQKIRLHREWCGLERQMASFLRDPAGERAAKITSIDVVVDVGPDPPPLGVYAHHLAPRLARSSLPQPTRTTRASIASSRAWRSRPLPSQMWPSSLSASPSLDFSACDAHSSAQRLNKYCSSARVSGGAPLEASAPLFSMNGPVMPLDSWEPSCASAGVREAPTAPKKEEARRYTSGKFSTPRTASPRR